MTGPLGGHEKFILCEFERGTGAREIYPSLDQINKMRSKKSKGFSGQNRKFKRFFRPKAGDLQTKKQKKKVFPEIARDFQAEIGNSSGFSGRNRKFKRFFRPKTDDLQKKKSSSQKRHKIWFQSTQDTNLDLDLRSRSPEPVNFFEPQSSLGGHNFRLGGTRSQLGARPRYAPLWRWVCIVPMQTSLHW